MRLILLCGGTGKRLWPLSNTVRSKQFLKLLPTQEGTVESMMQRVVRQINDSRIAKSITIATGKAQADPVLSQLGSDIGLVLEPERRNTFPAIALASAYLKTQGMRDDEVVLVMPCDPYVDASYFKAIKDMGRAVERGEAELVLMGIKPAYPSVKFGYIIPKNADPHEISHPVAGFKEKPDETEAKRLIDMGALWNGGVFAFRLGYILDKIRPYFTDISYENLLKHYSDFPRISFDYEVVEKARSLSVVAFSGQWKDLGTWDVLTSELPYVALGNVVVGPDVRGTSVINELDIPIVCTGVDNLVVSASPDGILVADKYRCENLKPLVDQVSHRPMNEERRWGWYKVTGHTEYADGHRTLTKLLHINAGCSISYQMHDKRDELWSFVDGEALLVVDDGVTKVGRGYVADIKAGQKHAVKALTDIEIIEVQSGSELVEEDIHRFDWDWDQAQTD